MSNEILNYVKKNIDNPCVSDVEFRQRLALMNDKVNQPAATPKDIPDGYVVLGVYPHSMRVGVAFSELGNVAPEFLKYKGITYRRGGMMPDMAQMYISKYAGVREYEAV